MNNLTDRDKEFAVRAIKSLTPKPGSILVLYVDPSMSKYNSQVILEECKRFLDDDGYEGIGVIAVPNGEVDISMLDEQDMEKLGWIRKEEQRGYKYL